MQPATLKALFEAYVEDLVNRGKGDETVARAAQTATVVEALMPELLTKPVGRITEADLFGLPSSPGRAGVLHPATEGPGEEACARPGARPAVYDQSRSPHASRDAEASPTRLQVPGRRLLP
jgi:hypothetical protein